jgi:hypothetical protein
MVHVPRYVVSSERVLSSEQEGAQVFGSDDEDICLHASRYFGSPLSLITGMAEMGGSTEAEGTIARALIHGTSRAED